MAHRVQFVPFIYSLVWGKPLRPAHPTRGHTLKENWPSLSHEASTVKSSSFGGGNSRFSATSMLECWLNWSCASLGRATTAAGIHKCGGLVMSKRQVSLWLLQSFQSLLCVGPWALCVRNDMDVSLMTRYSNDTQLCTVISSRFLY